jgi:hypothetical protein
MMASLLYGVRPHSLGSVVEVGDRRLVGNATSDQLAAFVGMTHTAEPFQAA